MSTPTPPPVKTTRRKFLRRALIGTAALGVTGFGTVGYGFYEASQIRIRRQSIVLPRLPEAFVGKTIAIIADLHHGPFVSLPFIRQAVAMAQELQADAYALVGDFCHKGTHTTEQLPPCLEALSLLKAPLGVFAIPGNHDMQAKGQVYTETIRSTPLTDLNNRAIRLKIGADELWFAGVDDLWWGKPDLDAALRLVPKEAPVILLAHNPDFAELKPDPRVDLILSGHTHGGQAYVPGLGAGWMPSRYGSKYRSGLVQAPASQVFVSRGLGEAGVPLRLNCPPEINLLTLHRQRLEV
ncbi:MAG: metallophosphoesterase [Fimbriiglobus sp.]